jgi:DNA-binding CsgD family transcriptional regulator
LLTKIRIQLNYTKSSAELHLDYIKQMKTIQKGTFPTSNLFSIRLRQILLSEIHFNFSSIKPLSRPWLLWCLLCCSLSVRSQGFAGLPLVRNHTSLEYKAGLQNFNIRQGRDGLIYVGNNYGLLEYDGETWRTYGVSSGTKVRSIAADSKGRVYAGSQGDFGFFEPDSIGRMVYTSLAARLDEKDRNFDETWNIYLDNDQVYFCTFSRIFIYINDKLVVFDPSSELDNSYLINGKLLVNRRGQGLSTYENNQLIPIKGGEFSGALRLSSIHPLRQGGLIISTFQNGIFRFEKEIAEPWNKEWQDYYAEAGINCMIRLADGRFAAGTQNEGLLLIDETGALLQHLNRGQGLENRTILSLFEDIEHNLWVGQNNVIARIQVSSPFTLIREQNGLPGTGYTAWSDGKRLFLGTNTGLYLRESENPDFQLVPGTEGQVYNLVEMDGSLLLSHHRGARLINNVAADPVSDTEGSWTFLKLSEQIMIEGTYSGLQLFEKENNQWKLRGPLEGFRESARVMALDQDGTLWVTHGYKGAFRILMSEDLKKIARVDFYGDQKGFPTNRLINVYAAGRRLIFTSEAGTFRYDKTADRFVPDELFTKLLGPGIQLWNIKEDFSGNIYYIGRGLFGMLKRNTLGEFEVNDRGFNLIRKYLNDDLLNLSIINSGEILFTAKEGFVHYNSRIPIEQSAGFQSLIRGITVSGDQDRVLHYGNGSLQSASLIKLDFSENNIRFNFAATTYRGDAGDISYQYKMQGFNEDWSEWTSQPSKEYTNLRERSYTFIVRAKNINGEISPETTFSFEIMAPWYRSAGAYLLYFIIAGTILFTGYKILNRKYRYERKLMAVRQKRELNRSQFRFKELSIESESRINELKNEKLESEIGHMKTELATATMHLLNKNEVMASIKGQLNVLTSRTEAGDVKQEIQQINRQIETNLTHDNDWEHFRFHFDRVHGDFINRMMKSCPGLTPQEIKLCSYLRLNLATKEIASLMNISVRGVEISRYRLRKKLGLPRSANLQEHILLF